MPFKEHAEFEPPDSEAKIWRYMDFTKFLAMIDRSALYFTRLDQLSKFDPFEGFYTKVNVLIKNVKFEDTTDEWRESTGITSKEMLEMMVDFGKSMREFGKHQRQLTFVNSWYIKDYESAAMWKLYLTSHEGIAIQSTYDRFRRCLDGYQDFEVHIGKIKYIDYAKDAISVGNVLSPFVYKRKSFKHESELRALIWTPQYTKNDPVNPENNKFKEILELDVRVSLDDLIERIYVAPNAPKWMVKLVSSIIIKYDLKKEVIRSDLASGPIY